MTMSLSSKQGQYIVVDLLLGEGPVDIGVAEIIVGAHNVAYIDPVIS